MRYKNMPVPYTLFHNRMQSSRRRVRRKYKHFYEAQTFPARHIRCQYGELFLPIILPGQILHPGNTLENLPIFAP